MFTNSKKLQYMYIPLDGEGRSPFQLRPFYIPMTAIFDVEYGGGGGGVAIIRQPVSPRVR